jgi:hypothetical protein
MTAIPTIDQLRDSIDSGATGEKVAHPDPAAVPLGTDAEAGGNPPTQQERALEARSRTLIRSPAPLNGPLLYCGAIFLVAVGILLIAWLS